VFDTLRLKWRIMRNYSALVRLRERDDFQGVMIVSFRGLTGLGDPKVDLQTAWSSSVGPLLLWGYCEAAMKLGHHAELFEMLSKWRPVYLEWMKGSTLESYNQYFAWFEETWRLNQAS
jgi:hypothetical protein